MSLFDLKAQYQADVISKPAYIAAMHRLHAGLFDYAEFIRTTDIARIEITDGAVLMSSRQTIGLTGALRDTIDWLERTPAAHRRGGPDRQEYRQGTPSDGGSPRVQEVPTPSRAVLRASALVVPMHMVRRTQR